MSKPNRQTMLVFVITTMSLISLGQAACPAPVLTNTNAPQELHVQYGGATLNNQWKQYFTNIVLNANVPAYATYDVELTCQGGGYAVTCLAGDGNKQLDVRANLIGLSPYGYSASKCYYAWYNPANHEVGTVLQVSIVCTC
jgi:hypothetical protein